VSAHVKSWALNKLGFVGRIRERDRHYLLSRLLEALMVYEGGDSGVQLGTIPEANQWRSAPIILRINDSTGHGSWISKDFIAMRRP